jgi:hypothetical protein
LERIGFREDEVRNITKNRSVGDKEGGIRRQESSLPNVLNLEGGFDEEFQ